VRCAGGCYRRPVEPGEYLALSFDDVLHYQKIIKILTETDRIMKEIKLPL
jgi:hypothetical protein